MEVSKAVGPAGSKRSGMVSRVPPHESSNSWVRVPACHPHERLTDLIILIMLENESMGNGYPNVTDGR